MYATMILRHGASVIPEGGETDGEPRLTAWSPKGTGHGGESLSADLSQESKETRQLQCQGRRLKRKELPREKTQETGRWFP